MRHPKKKSLPAKVSSLHDEAYRLQRGQFYPQRHEANIQQLCDQHPEHSSGEIDAVYRQACRIDHEARKWVESSQLTTGAKELLLEWLEDSFADFSRESLRDAIERAIPPETA